MPALNNQSIKERLNDDDLAFEKKLIISPILDEAQIKGVSVDLRLGTEFKVSIPTKSPLMGIVEDPIDQFFQSTYRSFGENFILHPNQLVLVNTFEYLKLPNDLLGLVTSRSSLNRIGLNISSIIHPGYSGTLTLQLENNGVNAINLTCGMRLIQLTLFEVDKPQENHSSESLSKYISNTKPILSQVNRDSDLQTLKTINSFL